MARPGHLFGARRGTPKAQTLLGLAFDTSAQAYARVLVGVRGRARPPAARTSADGRDFAFRRQVGAEMERRGWRLDYASRDFLHLVGEDEGGLTYVVHCHSGAEPVEANDVEAALAERDLESRDRALVVAGSTFTHAAEDCARWGDVALAVFAGGVWTYHRR